jgi:hypothetical protein
MNPRDLTYIIGAIQEVFMSKKIVLTVLLVLLMGQSKALSANEDQLTQLDTQRNKELDQITEGLIGGKILPDKARKLKEELDEVTKLESNAREDNALTATEAYNITKCLQKVQSHIDTNTHTTKVWMGIDSGNKGIHTKISDALAARKISKEQAETLEREYEKLLSREGDGYPTHRFVFSDAIALADDLQTLNSKIDQLIADAASVH